MKLRELKLDVLLNLAGTLLAGALMVWVIRGVTQVFAPAAAGLFLLARRTSASVANLTDLGMSRALYYYIPINLDSAAIRRQYLIFSVGVWLLIILLAAPLAYTLRASFAQWFFPGSEGQEVLSFWTIILALAISSSYLSQSAFFAQRQIVTAKLLQILSGSGIVLALLFYQGTSATPLSVTKYQALSVVAMSLLAFLAYLHRVSKALPANPASAAIANQVTETKSWVAVMRDFVRYGLPRCPQQFIYVSLTLIGPWLLRQDTENAGYLIIALTLLQIFYMVVTPVSMVALVVTARLMGLGKEDMAEKGARLALGASLYGVLPVVAAVWVWRDLIFDVWLGGGAAAAGASSWAMCVLCGMPSYIVFLALRGITETRWIQPSQVVAYYLLAPYIGDLAAVKASTALMLWVLGLMTVFWHRSAIGTAKDMGLWQVLVATAIVYVTNAGAKLLGLPLAPLIGIVAAALLLWALRRVLCSKIVRELWEVSRRPGVAESVPADRDLS